MEMVCPNRLPQVVLKCELYFNVILLFQGEKFREREKKGQEKILWKENLVFLFVIFVLRTLLWTLYNITCF